jgi:hypothetical protein
MSYENTMSPREIWARRVLANSNADPRIKAQARCVLRTLRQIECLRHAVQSMSNKSVKERKNIK